MCAAIGGELLFACTGVCTSGRARSSHLFLQYGLRSPARVYKFFFGNAWICARRTTDCDLESQRHNKEILTADGNVVPEVNMITTQAAAALTAITPKILASESLTRRARSILFPRLLSPGCCTLCTRGRAISRRQLMALESVYMRALRRATGTTFSKETSVNPSSVELLSGTHLPSLQCLLRRRRLGLFARLVRTDVRSLVALLNDRPAGIWWTRARRATDHDLESVGASFCANAWTRARRATDRDLASKRREKVHALVCTRQTTDRDLASR